MKSRPGVERHCSGTHQPEIGKEVTSIDIYRVVGHIVTKAFTVPLEDLFRVLRLLSIHDAGATYVF